MQTARDPGVTRRGLLVLSALVVGCGGGEAGRVEADRGALRAGLGSDERVVQTLQRVDALALSGKPAEASALLASEARPASSASRAQIAQLTPASAWGKARHEELTRLAADRGASLDRYEQALRGEIIERVVEALEEQKTLDRRGQALAGAIAQGP